MRFEIVVPDTTRADLQARLVTLTQRLSAQPELVAGIQFAENEALVLTPEQVAIIRQSQADIKAGKGLTPEEVHENLSAYKTEWLAANPR